MGTIIGKPWGMEEVILDEPGLKIKRLTVCKGMQTSLQYHIHREEVMTCIQGQAFITIGDMRFSVSPGMTRRIRRLENHRIQAGEDMEAVFIEIQRGELCVDGDIVRIEDDFNRK